MLSSQNGRNIIIKYICSKNDINIITYKCRWQSQDVILYIAYIYISKSTRHAYEQIIFTYLSQGLDGDVASTPVYAGV